MVGALVVGVSVIFAASALVYLAIQQDSEEKEKVGTVAKWESRDYGTDTPPEPLFSDSQDNQECRDVVEGFYKSATWTWESNRKNESKLNKSFQDILDKQAEYGIELIDNQEFLDWTTEDWEDSWFFDSDAKRPKPSTDMLEYFTTSIRPVLPFRDIDRMEQAFSILFHFRAQLGLEAEIAFRRLSMMYIPESSYAMCSENTKTLASIYVDYMYENAGDARPYNYYPLLDRLNEWLNEKYGK